MNPSTAPPFGRRAPAGVPRPVLALVAPGGTSARVAPLLALVGAAGVDVVSWSARSPQSATPDALVVAGLEALGEELPEVPVAVWVGDAAGLRTAQGLGATLTLSGSAEAVKAGAVFVSRVGIDLDRWPPIAPLVRQRWRERLGLPRELVVAVEAGHDPDDLATDLALASVAVVAGPSTALALALATPVVTSAETAERLSLRPGLDVEVADDPEAATVLARRIATSDHRAAALSRRGRRVAERQLDLGPAARAVITALGLDVGASNRSEPHGTASWVPDLISDRLAELAVPVASPLRSRAGAAFDLFVPTSPGVPT